MNIAVSPAAAEDLQTAYDFVATRSPMAADRLLIGLTETFGLLAFGLRVGRVVTLRNGRRVRSRPAPPYRICYRLRRDEMQVVRVYHQSRKLIERRSRR
ncbi:MAG: type II toxin-antitoxin system RelE/ParE family toxin [Planctomycetes bacterium]|nr:type II toxin-antitoxin system RelE/ParE family toxin [Planctomycetota bacterium]